MILCIDPGGTIRAVYGEAIDLSALGALDIRRASSVEPDEQGRWWVDLSPTAGPTIGPFALRSQALAAEYQWLINHWVVATIHQKGDPMVEFTVTVTSNSPKLKDREAVDKVISRFAVDRELTFGTRVNRETGKPYLVFWGYEWPEAWLLPEGCQTADFDPYSDETVYAQGADGFKEMLRQLAPFLEESLTVQAIGSTGSLFPLSACQWHIEPGAVTVEITEFLDARPQQSVSSNP